MFTGLIKAICSVETVRQAANTMQLTIDLADLAGQSGVGDSICVNGACLTITALNGTRAAFDVSGETLAKTTLAGIRPSAKVNIELAMGASDRFGGHFVLGHVDGVATIKAIDKTARFANIKFAAAPELLNQMVAKGSVAVDGISLTIAEIDKTSFAVAIIPQTLQDTTLASAKVGDAVNIETDIIVKTIMKQLENILPAEKKLTIEKLKEMGF